jgi:hypothetical protein
MGFQKKAMGVKCTTLRCDTKMNQKWQSKIKQKWKLFCNFFATQKSVPTRYSYTPLPDAWMCDTRAISTFITSIQYNNTIITVSQLME